MVANRKQHWVPDSYLQAWTDPNRPERHEPFVHLFDRQGNGHRRKSPAKIFNMPDLYTIFSEGQRNLRIEQHFGQREQEFVKVRRLIEAAEYGGSAEVAALYMFTAGMMARPPHKIDHMAHQWASIAADARAIRIDPKVRPIPKLRPKRDSARMTLAEAQRMADDPMGTWFPASLNAYYRALTQYFKCQILINGSPHPFLTSDNPAVEYHEPYADEIPGGPRRPRGLGTPGCEVTMAISPTHALKFTHGAPGVHDWIVLDWEGVFEVNFLTITRARQTIVSDREDLFFVKTILDRIAEVERDDPPQAR
jgi:hypothetical protein